MWVEVTGRKQGIGKALFSLNGWVLVGFRIWVSPAVYKKPSIFDHSLYSEGLGSRDVVMEVMYRQGYLSFR